MKEPESVRLILSPAARPIAEMVEMVSSASPPNVSQPPGGQKVGPSWAAGLEAAHVLSFNARAF